MKKIYAACLMLLWSLTVNATEITVHVYWPFAAGSQQATMIRSLIESANSSQETYQFVFMHKPGAGGSIAANSNLNDNLVSVLASTSSFYIRPMLYRNSHEIEKFNLINTICVGQPLAIFSANKNLLKDAEKQEITVGVIPGSITALLVRALQRQNTNLQILEIPFSSTPESTLMMLGGHINGSVNFIGKTVLSTISSTVHAIAISGSTDILGFRTFDSQGIQGLSQIVNDYYIFSPTNADPEIVKELHNILNSAINEKVKSLCEDDFGSVKTITLDEGKTIHMKNTKKWLNLTEDIQKE